MINIEKLHLEQRSYSSKVKLKELDLNSVRKIAGFDLSFQEINASVGAAVLEFPSLKVIETKHLITKAEFPYIPGLLAFREGPLILQAYYDLNEEPDVIMVEGHGIAHPLRAGLACYVGTELEKPVIGVAKNLLVGEVRGDEIVENGEVLGKVLRTKEHAKPIFVSPGNLVTVSDAAELVKRCIVPPHKLPEPIHLAHKIAKRGLRLLPSPSFYNSSL